jgi:hypothetical protein
MGWKSEILINKPLCTDTTTPHLLAICSISLKTGVNKLPKNNRPIKSHVWIQPVLTCKHDWEWIRLLQILWSIALKLQIGKDNDKKESKYQKYIY